MITLNSIALRKVIAPAASVAPQKSPMEVNAHLWLKCEKGLLTVGATNMTSWIESHATLEGKSANAELKKAFVDAALLSRVVGNLPDDTDVSLSLTEKGQLEIKTATSVAHLPAITDSPSKAMDMPTLTNATEFNVNGISFADQTAKLTPFTADMVTKPYLNCVMFVVSPDGVEMAATNQNAAATIEWAGKTKIAARAAANIPSDALEIVQRYFRSKEKVAIHFNGRLIAFALEDIRYVSTINIDAFPPVRRVTDMVKEKTLYPVTVQRIDLIDALKRTTPFLPNAKYASLAVVKHRLTITTRSEGREQTDSIACEYDETVAPINLNVPNLLAIMQHAGTDRVTLHIGTAKDAIFVQPMYEETPKITFSAFAQTIVDTSNGTAK